MNEIVKLMLDYSIRHEIEDGITLKLHDDGSGAIYLYLSDMKSLVFCFQDETEFLQKIKE